MNSLEGLTPEQIQELMKLGGLAEKDDLLKEQLAQAQALRAPRHGYGFWGGLTNGLADVSDKIFSGIEAHQAKTQLDANMAEQAKARGLAAGLLGQPAVPRIGYEELGPDGKKTYSGGY